MSPIAEAHILLTLDPSSRRELKRDTERIMSSAGGDTAEKAGRKSGLRFASSFGLGMKGLRGIVAGPLAGVAATAGAAFGARAIFGFVSAAGNLNETMSATTQIFGKNTNAVVNWSKSSAKSLGLSQQAALEGAVTFGNFFDQIGIGAGQSVKMSEGLVKMSSDFASFRNADPAAVMDAFASATRGEYDALQQFLPTINAANVQAEALRLTHKSSATALTEADKALALYSLAQKGAGAAAGDFARTSNGAANQQRIANAMFEDAKAKIGQGLLPAWTSLLRFLTSTAIPGLSALVTAFKDGNVTSGGFVGALQSIGVTAANLWRSFQQNVLPNLVAFGQTLVSTVVPILATFGRILTQDVVPALVSAVTWFTKNKDVLLAIGAALVTIKLAQFVGSIFTVIKATQAWIVVQGGLNAIMSANVIGIVVLAIAALVAGIVLAYNRSETFRKIVQGAWTGIKEAAVSAWSFIQPILKTLAEVLVEIGEAAVKLWQDYIQPAFEAIGVAVANAFVFIKDAWDTLYPTIKTIASIVIWLYGTIFKAYFELISLAVRTAFAVIKTVWQQVLKPTFDTIASVVSWLYRNVFERYFDLIALEVRTIFTVIRTYWQEILQPVIKAIASVVSWLWTDVIKPVLGRIVDGWSVAFDGMRWVWRNILSPVFTALKSGVVSVRDTFKAAVDLIGEVWSAILSGIRSVWRNILSPVFAALKSGVVSVRDTFKAAIDRISEIWSAALAGLGIVWRNVLSPVFSAFKSGVVSVRDTFKSAVDRIGEIWSAALAGLGSVWRNVLSPVFSAFKSGVVSIRDTFKSVVDAIGVIWAKLRDKAAAPIRFVVNTVYNQGILPFYNRVAGVFGAPKLKPITLRFARGGVVPGTSSREDNRLATVRSGEAIMVPEWTRAVGAKQVARWNKTARRGGASAVRNMMACGWPGSVEGGTPNTGRFPTGKPPPPGTRFSVHGGSARWGTDTAMRRWNNLARVTLQRGDTGSDPSIAVRIGDYGPVTWAGHADVFEDWSSSLLLNEHWGRKRNSGYRLNTQLHEFGHALGLRHDKSRASIMYPYVQANQLKPTRRDIATLRGLYGIPISGRIRVPVRRPSGRGGLGLPDFIGHARHALGMLKRIEGTPYGSMLARIPRRMVTLMTAKLKAAAEFINPVAGPGFSGSIPGGGSYSANVALGKKLAAARGWTGMQWEALYRLWEGESNWNHLADNPTSTAFGIPQFIASTARAYGVLGSRNPGAQIVAGMKYIAAAYGNPRAALAAWNSRSPHWYGGGGSILEPIAGIGLRTGRSYGFGERGPETVTPGIGGPGPVRLHRDDIRALGEVMGEVVLAGMSVNGAHQARRTDLLVRGG